MIFMIEQDIYSFFGPNIHGIIYIHDLTWLVGGLEHEFYFSVYLGRILPTDFHIFQRGSNHQPVWDHRFWREVWGTSPFSFFVRSPRNMAAPDNFGEQLEIHCLILFDIIFPFNMAINIGTYRAYSISNFQAQIHTDGKLFITHIYIYIQRYIAE